LTFEARSGRVVGHDATDLFDTRTWRIDVPVDAAALARELAESDVGIVRAKGFVSDPDGRYMTVQVVGRRWRVSPRPTPRSSSRGTLVCIATRAGGELERVGDVVRRHTGGAAPTPAGADARTTPRCH
jgi:hypothetical protein